MEIKKDQTIIPLPLFNEIKEIIYGDGEKMEQTSRISLVPREMFDEIKSYSDTCVGETPRYATSLAIRAIEIYPKSPRDSLISIIYTTIHLI